MSIVWPESERPLVALYACGARFQSVAVCRFAACHARCQLNALRTYRLSLGRSTCALASLSVGSFSRPVPAFCAAERRLRAGKAKQSFRGAVVVHTLPPNPSIERDVQGLAPSAAPHVKR